MLRLVRFGIVGGLVTLVFMALNWIFALRLGATPAYLAAYPLAVAVHFCLNKWWTFGDRSALRRRQLGEYAAMMLAAFLIQTAVFESLTHFTPVVPWLASGLAAAAQMTLSFLFMQRRVFAVAAE